MRFMHSADWHVGRTLHGVSLLEDQAHLLDQFVDLACQEKPDVVILAGDIYDRSVPPNEAIGLLDDVLCRLVLDLKLQVVVIAGNHDGPARLSFGSRLLKGQGLHMLGSPASPAVVLEDRHGPVHFYPIPFAEPAIVRHCLDRHDLEGHQAAMQCLLDGLWARHPKGIRAVAAAHCFVTGGTASESERPVSIGGAGMIDADVFKGFDYVALGHLHRPQACDSDGRVRYSGSLMRYSFTEVDHEKAVLIVDMDAQGECDVKAVELSPRRQVRRIDGLFDDVVATAKDDLARDDYLIVTLLDQGPIFDAMGKLRLVYPNLLHIDRPAVMPTTGADERIDHRKMTEMELSRPLSSRSPAASSARPRPPPSRQW